MTVKTFADWLIGNSQPTGKSLEKLRAFLDAQAKGKYTGNEIRPIERVPLKIALPPRQFHYARLCPFCRKARGKIRSAAKNQIQGICPKSERADQSGKSYREALRPWNGRQ